MTTAQRDADAQPPEIILSAMYGSALCSTAFAHNALLKYEVDQQTSSCLTLPNALPKQEISEVRDPEAMLVHPIEFVERNGSARSFRTGILRTAGPRA